MTVHTLPLSDPPPVEVPDLTETEDGERYLVTGHHWTDEQIRVAVAAHLAAEWADDWPDAYANAYRIEIIRGWWVPSAEDPEFYERAAQLDPGAEPLTEVRFV